MDLSTIQTFLAQFGEWGVILGGLLFITSKYWTPYVPAWVKSLFKKSADTTVDDGQFDVAEVEALHLLQARAKRRGCAKLKASVREVEKDFFNHGVVTETVVTPEVKVA